MAWRAMSELHHEYVKYYRKCILSTRKYNHSQFNHSFTDRDKDANVACNGYRHTWEQENGVLALAVTIFNVRQALFPSEITWKLVKTYYPNDLLHILNFRHLHFSIEIRTQYESAFPRQYYHKPIAAIALAT